jgi:hypothetical protein
MVIQALLRRNGAAVRIEGGQLGKGGPLGGRFIAYFISLA